MGDLAASIAKAVLGFFVGRRDQSTVEDWLRANTADRGGETHKSVLEISTGVRLSESRVLDACLSNRSIHRSLQHPELWSVWCEEPKSVYEERGIRFF